LLEACADGNEHSSRELASVLTSRFSLTREELAEMLPSGVQTIFVNRVAWAKSYLKQAGLLEYPKRGTLKITPKGRDVLGKNLQSLNIRYLKTETDFLANRKNSGRKVDESLPLLPDAQATPDEMLVSGYKHLREALVIELLDCIKRVSSSRFEQLVVELLLKMGYGGTQDDAGQVVGKSGDGGIDGIINEDRLGLDVVYIQAKRWEADVGRPEIQKFVGALAGNKASKGVFITSSGFTKEAKQYASQVNHRVVLIDGVMLADLMIDYDLGVSTKEVYTVKRLDSDYFEED
jgi:restriction system protein